ncbi:hypothetical protein Droror1_Dr00024505 [Drosera rotundifolia]
MSSLKSFKSIPSAPPSPRLRKLPNSPSLDLHSTSPDSPSPSRNHQQTTPTSSPLFSAALALVSLYRIYLHWPRPLACAPSSTMTTSTTPAAIRFAENGLTPGSKTTPGKDSARGTRCMSGSDFMPESASAC